jgi:hypothetical protein
VSGRQGSLALLVIQACLVLSLFVKLGWDSATLPRVWARTVPIDPDDPLRGRYVRLWLDAADRRSVHDDTVRVEFAVEESTLAVREAHGWPGLFLNPNPPQSARGVVVAEPVAFFIPEHDADPSRLESGQELWVEVVVPRRGLPRPVRIQVRAAGSGN